MAQTLEVKRPSERQAAISKAMARRFSATAPAGSKSAAQSNSPTTAIVLRTNVADLPFAIQRSENQPPNNEVAAIPQYGSEPNTAISFVEKPRWLMRYEGNQVRMKIQT